MTSIHTIMLERHLVIIFFIGLCVTAKAQNNVTYTSQDSYDTITHFLCTFTDNAYLIKNDSAYKVQIDNIVKLRDGLCIIGRTIIDNENVVFPFVTTSFNGHIGKKIRKGHSYKLRFRRYFIIPSRGFDNHGITVDLLIDGKIITLNDGLFSYWFVSPDVEHGQLLSTDACFQKNRIYKNHRETLFCMTKQFVHYMANTDSTELPVFVDTIQMKKTILSHGIKFWYLPQRQFSIKEFLVPHENHNNDTRADSSFNQVMVDYMKKNYYLPEYQLGNIYIVEISLLNYSISDQIYTMQIIWEVKSISKIFVTILSVKETNNKFSIIGIGNSYYGYRMNSPSSNYEFVPTDFPYYKTKVDGAK